MDLFAIASLRERLPNVVLEALAMEVPELATRRGGTEAVAKDGENALLAGVNSVDELERSLAQLATGPAPRARPSHTARAILGLRASIEGALRGAFGIDSRCAPGFAGLARRPIADIPRPERCARYGRSGSGTVTTTSLPSRATVSFVAPLASVRAFDASSRLATLVVPTFVSTSPATRPA